MAGQMRALLIIAMVAAVDSAATSTCAAGAGNKMSSESCSPQPQGRAGQAMLQVRAGDGGLIVESQGKQNLELVAVGVSGLLGALPQELARWTDSTKGATLLQNQARTQEPEPNTDITTWIKETLLPQAEQTKNQLQREVEVASGDVRSCSDTAHQQQDALRDQETTLVMGETRHSECMTDEEQKLKMMNISCGDMQSFCDNMDAPKSLGHFNLKNNSIVEILAAMESNWRFYNDNYVKFMNLKAVCEKSTEVEGDTQVLCSKDKENIEQSYCGLRKSRIEVCQEYSGCYAHQTAKFQRVLADVRVLESHVKENYQQLACFKLEESSGSDSPCEIGTEILKVNYPSMPEKDSCVDTVNTKWNYSGVVCPEIDGIIDDEDDEATTAGPQGSQVHDSGAPTTAPPQPVVEASAVPQSPVVATSAPPEKPVVETSAAPQSPVVATSAPPQKPVVATSVAPQEPIVATSAPRVNPTAVPATTTAQPAVK